MISINCDLGEWEALSDTEWIMRRIDVANVACGVHAGSARQLEKCREFAEKFKVNMGMHPGVKGDKGRGDVSDLSPDAFTQLLDSQYDFFYKHAGKPAHIKLHGSLYHLSEKSLEIRRHFITFAKKHELEVICLSAGSVYNQCLTEHQPTLAEVFLDRGYSSDGGLLPRGSSAALLETASEASQRMSQLLDNGTLNSQCGTVLKLPVDTVCIHSDSEICKKWLSVR